MRRVALATLVTVALAACSAAPPVILYPEAQLFALRDPQSGTVAERLRLFVAVDDPDGADDPARLYVVNDEADLYWEVEREGWVRVEHAGDTWFGVPDIGMPDGSALPRGAYRVIVEDRGLARDEAEFFLTARPLGATTRFPRLERLPEGLAVDYDAAVTLRVYDATGRMVVNRIVSPGLLPSVVAAEIPDAPGHSIFLGATEGAVRPESGPYPTR